jgi:hypothetical protein
MSRRDLCWTALRWLGAAVATTVATDHLPGLVVELLVATLVALPLIVAGFVEIDIRARRRGARPLPRAVLLGEGGALLAWLVLVFIHPRLGLPERAAMLLFAGLLLLLAHHLGRELARLRPLLGARLPARPHGVFFLLPFLAYSAILPWSAAHHPPDGDEPYYLLVVHSLAYDFDADLTNNYRDRDYEAFLERPIEPQPGDPTGPRGELYSRHNLLLPLFLAPAYRLGGKGGALLGMAALAAALAWATLKLARHYHPDRPGEALLAYGLVAFASPLVLYSYQVWVEVPAALLLVLALDQMLTYRVTAQARRATWGLRQWCGIGLPILLLPLVKIRFMLLAVPLLVLAWWYAGRPRKPLVVLAALLGGVALGLLVHNQLVYDNPLKIHSWEELSLYRYSAAEYLEGGFGLFYDAAFGLFGAYPLWLLLIPAGFLALARRERLVLDLLVLNLPYLLVVAPRSEWYGGWSPPFRYALVALPFLALLLVPLLTHRHRGGARALTAALGLATLALSLLWLVVPGWTYNFANGTTYLLEHLGERLGADAARLFPSAVRPRAATWLWPLATSVLVPVLFWFPRRLRRPARWGSALLLVAVALVPTVAVRLPTRALELEDAYVEKGGGHPFPHLWVTERTRFPGGWVLRQGERITAPVVPGGTEAVIRLSAHYIDNGPGALPFTVWAGDRALARVEPSEWGDEWRDLTLGPVLWPPGIPLVIEVDPVPGPLNGVAFDRADFHWR